MNSINYFINYRLIYSSLTFEEFKKVVYHCHEIFKHFLNKKINIDKKFLKLIFLIAEKNVEEAYKEYKKLIIN